MSVGAPEKLVVSSTKYDVETPIAIRVGERMAWIFERVANMIVMVEDRAGNLARLQNVWPENLRSYASIYDHVPPHLVLTEHESVVLGSDGISVFDAKGSLSTERTNPQNSESLRLAFALDGTALQQQIGVTAFYGAVLLEEFEKQAGTTVTNVVQPSSAYLADPRRV